MSKFSVILTSLRKSGRFPIPVKVGATPIGTAIYDNNRASHFLKIDGETFLKHAEALCSMAKGGNAWYANAVEIESEATSRETELMAEIDRLQRELFDAQREIKGQAEVVSVIRSVLESPDGVWVPYILPAIEPAPGEEPEIRVGKVRIVVAEKVEQENPFDPIPQNATVKPEALTQNDDAVSLVKQEGPAYTEAGLLALNMREQRALAKELGVPNYTKAKTEKELVALILAHVQADQNPEGNG